MDTVTLSPKYEVVIPRRVREALGWRPGDKLQALVVGKAVQLVAVGSMSAMRGSSRGIDTTVERKDDRV